MSKPLIRFLFLGDPRTDRRVKNFIAFFIEQGYEAELFFATPGESELGLNIEGVRIKQLVLDYSGGPRMFLQYARVLQHELRSSEPCEILFACELFSLGAAATERLNRQAKKLIYDARELYTELPSVANSLFKKWFWKRQERIGLQKTDLVIVTAPDDANAIREVHNYLPPSVLVRNLPRREDYQSNNYLRDYFHISTEKKVFVYVGGLQEDRGLEKMIDQMSRLRDDAVFILIGKGALSDQLLALWRKLDLDGIVFFHPPIASENVIRILSSADVGISLIEQHSKSYQLALPSKVFEYMLAGLPVISSPLKQVKDLFNSTAGILFVDPDNSDELLSACRKAMFMSSDIELTTKMYVEAYNHFTFESDAAVLKNFLSKYITSAIPNLHS